MERDSGRIPQSKQLCWCCKKATNPYGNDCTWSNSLIPVNGWSAKPVVRDGNGRKYDSYEITRCPLFDYDGGK